MLAIVDRQLRWVLLQVVVEGEGEEMERQRQLAVHRRLQLHLQVAGEEQDLLLLQDPPQNLPRQRQVRNRCVECC